MLWITERLDDAWGVLGPPIGLLTFVPWFWDKSFPTAIPPRPTASLRAIGAWAGWTSLTEWATQVSAWFDNRD